MKFAKIFVLFVIALMTTASVAAHAQWTAGDYDCQITRQSVPNPISPDPSRSNTKTSVTAADNNTGGEAFIGIDSWRNFSYKGFGPANDFSLTVNVNLIVNVVDQTPGIAIAKAGGYMVTAPGSPNWTPSFTKTQLVHAQGMFFAQAGISLDADVKNPTTSASANWSVSL